MRIPHRGKLIVLDGPDGCGKSTQARMLCHSLVRLGYAAIHLREPGGTRVGERIRRILLDRRHAEMCPETELLLYMSSRAQLVRQMILPALEQGKIVVSERFLSSSIVYQGCGAGLDVNQIRRIGAFAVDRVRPALLIVLDVPARVGRGRMRGAPDRIESRGPAYQRRVRKGFRELARLIPDKVQVLSGTHPAETIHKQILGHVLDLLP